MLPRLIHVARHHDERGWFSETYNAARFAAIGIDDLFVQDNHSFSARRGTVRGLHFQRPPHAQAKLVRCAAGAVRCVAVDIRDGSPTYGGWVHATLTAEQGEQFHVPSGFAHGFVTLTTDVHLFYKVSAAYAPQAESSLLWNDPALAIDWPLAGVAPTLSDKDAAAPPLSALTPPFPYDGTPLTALAEVSL